MLKQFLGNKFQDNEIKELIHRIDLNNDKKISYEEFQDLFFPFQTHLHLARLSKIITQSIIQSIPPVLKSVLMICIYQMLLRDRY